MRKAPWLMAAVLATAGVSLAADPIRVMLLDGESGGPYHKWALISPLLKKQLEETGPYWYYKDGKLTPDESAGAGGSHGLRKPYQVEVRAGHPITDGLPKLWMHQGDELYAHLRGPGKNVTALATAYSDPANGGSGH